MIPPKPLVRRRASGTYAAPRMPVVASQSPAEYNARIGLATELRDLLERHCISWAAVGRCVGARSYTQVHRKLTGTNELPGRWIDAMDRQWPQLGLRALVSQYSFRSDEPSAYAAQPANDCY